MTATEAVPLSRSVEKTRQWIDDLARLLGRPTDQKYALRVLRGFLHTLRDRLPVEETAQLAAQLPELLRGIYFEGWRPSATPQRYHDLRTFLERIAAQAGLAGETEASYGATAAARVLRDRLGEVELDKVRGVLPHEIAAFLASPSLSTPGPST